MLSNSFFIRNLHLRGCSPPSLVSACYLYHFLNSISSYLALLFIKKSIFFIHPNSSVSPFIQCFHAFMPIRYINFIAILSLYLCFLGEWLSFIIHLSLYYQNSHSLSSSNSPRITFIFLFPSLSSFTIFINEFSHIPFSIIYFQFANQCSEHNR